MGMGAHLPKDARLLMLDRDSCIHACQWIEVVKHDRRK